MPRFSSLPGSFNQVYKMAMTELDFDDMVEQAGSSGMLAVVYYYSFTFMVMGRQRLPTACLLAKNRSLTVSALCTGLLHDGKRVPGHRDRCVQGGER